MDVLYNKRFGLPSNFSLSEDSPDTFAHYCNCGNYNHVACIFVGRGENLKNGKKIQVLSYGINQYADVDGKEPTIHAEYDAISKLPPLDRRRSRNLYSCNIFVTRVSRANRFGHSRPCSECVHNLVTLPALKGYNIKNVYFTNQEGNIVRTRLTHLMDEKAYLTRYQRKHQKSLPIL